MANTKKAPRERCTSKSRQTGERCKNYPPAAYPEITVCRFHGGASPHVQRKARERRLENQVRNLFNRMEITPVDDPLTELSHLAGQVVAWKDHLAAMVDNLKSQYRYETEFNEAIRGEVALFERALDRCAQVLGLIAKLNIDERLAAITERQAKMLEDGLFAAFDAAGLGINDADQKEQVARAFARHLTVVSAA